MIVPKVLVVDPEKLTEDGTKDNYRFRLDISPRISWREKCNAPVLGRSRIGGRVFLLSVMLTLCRAVKMSLASWFVFFSCGRQRYKLSRVSPVSGITILFPGALATRANLYLPRGRVA